MPRNSKNVKPKNTSDLAAYLFHEGTNYEAYKYFGCHIERTDSGFKYTFRVWVPNADKVVLSGDFNGWSDSCLMTKQNDGGIWEYFFESEHDYTGNCYKYLISGKNGTHYKSDPYAVYGETLLKTASYVYELKDYDWHDESWLKYRNGIFCSGNENFCASPVNIYEVHLGSWKTRDGRSNVDGDAYLTYRELADDLCAYVKNMGYTHVELLPIAEHPYDGSWGYQVCGYYAPTSRYGSPEDFKYFVDKLHSNGVGVILDWVPAHFPKDEHGLFEFDGSRLYEYQGDDRFEHKGWGTRCFDVGRGEVQSFLISNALYWLKEYHIDGLRVDAVASMLYLDYDRKPGEWFPNKNGDNKNLEAVEFFRKLNCAVFERFPDVLMIAEESTAWPMITHPVSNGGLGFNYKWNMGWANDFFDYIAMDPYFRQGNHKCLTFPLMYAFSENYVLPVSHDEVVHGKKSLLDKCFGTYEQKFATDRAFLTLMMTYPGKKLLFMGQEYGQFREWDYENQLEWFMLKYDMHDKLHSFVRDLNHFYLANNTLWEMDHSQKGFKWVYPDLDGYNTVVYRRFNSKKEELLVVISFSPNNFDNFEIDVKNKEYELVLSSDDEKYGGTGYLKDKFFTAFQTDDNKNRIKLNLPGLCALIFKPVKNNKSKRG